MYKEHLNIFISEVHTVYLPRYSRFTGNSLMYISRDNYNYLFIINIKEELCYQMWLFGSNLISG